MDCCSPDVGDCQKCHPELWIQKGGSYCNWIPKKQNEQKKQRKTRSNRKASKLSHPRAVQKGTRKQTL
jgi:hypothetical protein